MIPSVLRKMISSVTLSNHKLDRTLVQIVKSFNDVAKILEKKK